MRKQECVALSQFSLVPDFASAKKRKAVQCTVFLFWGLRCYIGMMLKTSPQKTKTLNIDLWMPELFISKGGIQVFSEFFLQAIRTIYLKANFTIFLKNDTDEIVNQNRDRLLHIPTYSSGKVKLSLRTLLFALRLISSAIAQKPDLVIMMHLNFAPIALLLKQLIGTKYIAIAHGIEAWNIQNPILKKSLQAADLILAVSNFTRDRLCQELSLSPDKVGILHNTFDVNAWKIAPKPQYLLEKYGIRPEQKIILTVSRLIASEQYKGYDQLLEVMPIVRQAIPDLHYIIVGKGSDRDRIEQIIQQKDLQNCVTLAGFIPDEDLCDFYNLCDLFAMPSKGEGFGIVYLEALACGKPVLAGNLDGAIDALCQGNLGVLINPDHPQAIAEAIIKILSGQHENSVIYHPEILRQQVTDTFGFTHFQTVLSNYLSEFL
jgi:glycosyltransferase involved in cell wall biosynthesis